MLIILIILYTVKTGLTTTIIHELMDDSELAYYFHTTNSEKILQNYEIIYLPIVDRKNLINYQFNAFNQPFILNLETNTKIISPYFTTNIINGENIQQLPEPTNNCHYLDVNENSVAAISLCHPKSMQGLIFLDNTTLEINPLTDRLHHLLNISLDNPTVPHLIRHVTFESPIDHQDLFPILQNVYSINPIYKANHRPANGGMTVELALFFDEAAYKIFAPFMNYDDSKLQDMLLAYMNGVQALYHHPSLGTSLELVLVRLDIMKKQPRNMPHYNGERGKLLDSFCSYQNSLNVASDDDPAHWDMALYVSGLDFFAYENGRKSGVTMGLATVGGVCLDEYACIIAELGTTNAFGKPYPSAGFTSVYILAHEMGHNLGMHHDGVGNACPKEGYVMSPSRGTSGETQWSSCSARVMSELNWAKCLQDSAHPAIKNLDHTKFMDSPGQIFTSKKQCEILLRDNDAIVSPNQVLSTICYNLQCKTPHRSGYYFAGPALDGTECGTKRYCFGGECIEKYPPRPVVQRPGGWSQWTEEACQSGCTNRSRGYTRRRRQCNNPQPINADCVGASVDYALCDDRAICKQRVEVDRYAGERCKEFARLLPELDAKGVGLQAPHEEGRPWMGCTVFCRRADSGTFYTPRFELNDLGVSPYFPDGTWCHRELDKNYYCLHHHCVPEDFHFSKNWPLLDVGDEVPFPQNAHPHAVVPLAIKPYLSLDTNGKPVRTMLAPGDGRPSDDDEEVWETDDFIEIPGLREKYSQKLQQIQKSHH